MNYKKALILAPHTDDGELGCGATISKMLREKTEVYYVAFSSCKESLPKGAPEDLLVKEMYVATGTLGIPKENVRVLDFKVRYFESNRQEILESMISLLRDIDPDIVFCPSIHDIHQDHATVANECLRAFKKKTILQYELPWNNFTFNNQLFSVVEKCDVEKKVAAIKKYDSQAGRDYTDEDFIKGLLKVHGVQIGKAYAEVFEVHRLIMEGKIDLW